MKSDNLSQAFEAVADAAGNIAKIVNPKPGLTLAQHELDLKRRQTKALEAIANHIDSIRRDVFSIVLGLLLLCGIVALAFIFAPDLITFAKR